MKFSALAVAALGFLPSVMACNGYAGGIPKATAHHSNSKVIEVAAGKVYDGKWAKFDRGKGACKQQKEGGKLNI